MTASSFPDLSDPSAVDGGLGGPVDPAAVTPAAPPAPAATPDSSAPTPPALAPPAPPAPSPYATWTPPDTSKEDAEYEADRKAARDAQARASEYDLKAADQAEAAAKQLQDAETSAQQTAAAVPDQAAIYQQSMHAAAPIATLMALGGRSMGLTGGMMLGALTGFVKGMNAGAASTVEEQWKKYQAANEQMKQKLNEIMNYNKLMQEAYAGRADAYQKAAAAARRMAGDDLDQKKQKIMQSLDAFKTMESAREKLETQNLKLQQLHQQWQEFQMREGRLEEKARQVQQNGSPQQKQRMQGLKAQWDNYKAQIAQIQKAEGQFRSDLSVKGDKGPTIANFDAKIADLQGRMTQIADQIEAVAAGGVDTLTRPQGAAPTPAANTPPINALKEGEVARFANGTSWTLQNGQPVQVSVQ